MRYPSQPLQVELMAAGAVLLSLIALALLWRQFRMGTQLARLQATLASEHRLRGAAEGAQLEYRARVCQLLAERDGVQEAERQRIARDIHDDLGQNLLALKMDLSALANAHPPLAHELVRIAQHVEASIHSLRTIIRDLRPEALDHGLRTAVEQQLHQFTRLSGIACRLRADQTVFNAPPDPRVDTVLYRILQESLSNIARHAQATRVDIALCRQQQRLILTVSDNGVGLPGAPARRNGGLLGIEDRVTQAGGQFHVASRPGQGTALSMSFPLDVVHCQEEADLPAAK